MTLKNGIISSII